MIKWWVYILLSEKDKKTYLGSTNNLNERIRAHNKGEVKATAYRTPLRLIYEESYDSESKARKRETFLKTTPGRRELKEIFKTLNINWGD